MDGHIVTSQEAKYRSRIRHFRHFIVAEGGRRSADNLQPNSASGESNVDHDLKQYAGPDKVTNFSTD